MKINYKAVSIIIAISIVGFLIWYFSEIVVVLLISVILSLMGHPIIRFFDSLHFKKIKLPHTLNTIFTLVILISAISGIFILILPPIIMQAKSISEIDFNSIQNSMQQPLQSIEQWLLSHHIIQQGQTMQSLASTEMSLFLKKINIISTFGDFITLLAKLLVDVFCVIFITFFFLKDEGLFFKSVLLFIPEKHKTATEHVFATSKRILSRYFLGLMAEMLSVFVLVSAGLFFIGVSNAMLIGFIAAVMVIIPYVGVLISAGVAIMLCIASNVGLDFYIYTFPLIVKMLIVFTVAKIIDDFILQPFIYSNSVKAHPLEIFIIIIISGSLAGIVGMMLAIPVYTLIRIVAKEFLSKFNIVKKLTGNL